MGCCSHADVVKILLANDADVNAMTAEDLQTPLHKAALHAYLDCAKLLLKHGALVNGIFSLSFRVSHGSSLSLCSL